MGNEDLKIGDIVEISGSKEFNKYEYLHKYIGVSGVVLEINNKDDPPPFIIDTFHGEIAVYHNEVKKVDREFIKRYKDYEVIHKKPLTKVILNSGETGISKCLSESEYDVNKGVRIAYLKAIIKKNNKRLKTLYNDYYDLLSDTDKLEGELRQLCT